MQKVVSKVRCWVASLDIWPTIHSSVIFGGCVGGLYVHHLYTKWKKTHPDGSMNEFVSDNKDYLPKGWEERLTSVGDTTDLKPGSAGGGSKSSK